MTSWKAVSTSIARTRSSSSPALVFVRSPACSSAARQESGGREERSLEASRGQREAHFTSDPNRLH
eukprot:3013913-Pyramimonas_sp.AAC.1